MTATAEITIEDIEAATTVERLVFFSFHLFNENQRLREQISESHLHGRVVELVNECSRHEAEARAARAELKVERAVVAMLRAHLEAVLLEKTPQ